jgi:hypothetical protein
MPAVCLHSWHRWGRAVLNRSWRLHVATAAQLPSLARYMVQPGCLHPLNPAAAASLCAAPVAQGQSQQEVCIQL